MSLYRLHVFVCENRRPEDDPRGCCSAKGSPELRARLKTLVKKAGLQHEIRVNAAGCLGQCEHGTTVVVYPEGVWYGGVGPDDAEVIFREHLVGGRPVSRLLLRSQAEPS